MKRMLLAIFGVLLLLLTLSPSARADTALSLTVGLANITCDNSTPAGVLACTTAGFSTSLGSNIIVSSGPINIGGYTINSVTITGNQPGTAAVADTLGTQFAITNVSGTDTLVVEYASNNFVNPVGSPLGLSTSQSGTFTVAQAGDKQTFTGYGNAANTLAVAGVPNVTPDCVNVVFAPPEAHCHTDAVPTSFTRSGNFALAARGEITMAQGDTESFQETVAASTAPLSVACVAQATGQVNVPYDSFITASGGIAPYTFALNSGSLPPGLMLNANTGEVSGTPTSAGAFSFTVKATDSTGGTAQTAVTPNCGITIVPPTLGAACVAQVTGQVGVFYSSFIQATGGTPSYTFSLNSGSLPPGLNLNSTTGQISGTPTSAGSFSFTVKVTDSTGGTALVAITPNCGITIAPPPSATCVAITAVQGVAITPVTMTGSGGAGGPYTFSASGLPTGLTMSSGGTISGAPTVSGTFNYTVTVTDKNGNTGTVNCSVTVTPPPPPPGLAKGDTATIGFWHNKNGQALILSLNGGATSQALGNWLATNFPNLYGSSSPNNLAGKTNAYIANYFLQAFGVSGQKTYAQVLAGALAAYSTNSNLAGGNYAAGYGFNVSTTGTGGKSYNTGSDGTAIGLLNNTNYTILQLLNAANAAMPLSTSEFNALNNIFSGINQTGDIS